MNNFLSKIKDFVGLNEQPYEEDCEFIPMDDEDPYPQPSQEEEMRRRGHRITRVTETAIGTKMSNVIDMPGINGNYEVLLMEPRSFEEMPQALQALQERKMVVLNLTMMEPDQAQRAVDFVAGGTYAMNGHQERVGESIFLFTPSSVQVTTSSGIVHEVSQPSPMRSHRISSPTPAWTGETTRIAQSG